ncbi:hypothetical protein NC652_028789 [Populus alba x Populus x berolinensis]|nr:hypothetical protein NC652_028789 [Populus alba x Populus x berolinensis]
MFIVGTWNIWGLNGSNKQKNVQAWTHKNNLDIIGLLETKIGNASLNSITCKLTPPHWKYLSNITSSTTCRILVGWNTQKLHLTYLHSASQWLTCEATLPNNPTPIRLTFIYGHNTPAERLSLWRYISEESSINTCTPWLLLGDFNAIMQVGDRSGGNTHWPGYQNDFNNCMSQSGLLQVPYTGLKYTWHNGQQGSNTIQKKLDWIFGNPCLFSTWPAAHATVQPRSISDHSPMTLSLQSLSSNHRQSPFKFLNIWADRTDFLPTVALSWHNPVHGNPMFQFTTKLSRLKTDLRQLHKQHTNNITDRVIQAKTLWAAAQIQLDQNPTSESAQAHERTLATQYMQLCRDEESYFKNKIHSLQDEEGNVIHEQQELGKMASIYFETLLTAPHATTNEEVHTLYPITITEESKAAALLPITDDDIKAALFSISDSKAPGPDGYNALFYKKS